jgi:hypothetical protein
VMCVWSRVRGAGESHCWDDSGMDDKETETIVPAMDWAGLYTTTRLRSCDLLTKTLPKRETKEGP